MPVCLDNRNGVSIINISGITVPDEADTLFTLLRENLGAPVDLSGLEHLHTALLQLLMAAGSTISSYPEDSFWQICLADNNKFKEEPK
jgi:hypothetical protein